MLLSSRTSSSPQRYQLYCCEQINALAWMHGKSCNDLPADRTIAMRCRLFHNHCLTLSPVSKPFCIPDHTFFKVILRQQMHCLTCCKAGTGKHEEKLKLLLRPGTHCMQYTCKPGCSIIFCLLLPLCKDLICTASLPIEVWQQKQQTAHAIQNGHMHHYNTLNTAGATEEVHCSI